MNKKPKKEQIHILVTREEKEALQKAAEKEKRSLSNYLVIAGLERMPKTV